MNRLKKCIIGIAIMLVYLVPIVAIMVVSKSEIKEYDMKVSLNLDKKPYGELLQPTRMTIDEYFIVDGVVTSETRRKMKLTNGTGENINLNIKIGDEVYTGQKIGYEDTQKIYASCNGIVEDIVFCGEKSYVEVLCLDDLILAAKVGLDAYSKVNEYAYDAEENKMMLISKSNQVVEGKYLIKFKVATSKYRYGMEINNFKLYTGKKIKNALVLDSTCVYQKDGREDKYVRLFNKNGEFLEEKQVEVSYESDNFVCVTGIDEHVYCDSGYSLAISDENYNEEVFEE